MKNFRTFVLLAVCFCLTLVSCQEKEQPVEPSVKDAVLTIDITGNKTKATGVEHGDQTKDNIVNTVDIFVFNNKALSAGIGMLDVHKHYAKEELKDLSALKVETTTGSKKIVVIANAHRTWKGVMSYQNLLSQEALLRAENVSDFTMSAEQDVDVATTNIALSITLERLIARVCVTGIKTNFAGTPYEGQTDRKSVV